MSDVPSSATRAFLRPGGSTGGCGGHSRQLLESRNEYQPPGPTLGLLPGPGLRLQEELAAGGRSLRSVTAPLPFSVSISDRA